MGVQEKNELPRGDLKEQGMPRCKRLQTKDKN